MSPRRPPDGHHPSAALQRQHQAAAGALPDVGNRPHRFPIGWGVVRDREYCRGIADIDPDDGFFGHRLSDRFEQAARQITAPGGINDQIGGQRLAFCVGVLKADRDDRHVIRRGYEVAHAAARTQGDVGMLLDPLPHHELDEWAGHRIRDKAEIALRERIVAWHLDANIEGDAKRHCSGAGEILFKAGKQLAERALTAGQESMNVPGLGDAGSVHGVRRQRVAFQYDDPLEMIGERPRRRQTADTGADDNSLLADKSGRHPCLR